MLGAAGVVIGIGAVTVEKAPASGAPAAGNLAASKSSAGKPVAGKPAEPARLRGLLPSRTLHQEHQVSRSANRPPLEAVQRAHKAAALPMAKQAVSGRLSRSVGPADPRAIAIHLLAGYGWSGEYGCLNELYIHESSWEIHATNPFSGAYGIPQALPASKMASYGDDWATNPVTQLRWGLNYIRLSYGTPCGAWAFWQAHHWY